MALSEEAWESFSRGSAIRRAGRAGFARNVCVAMGNWLSAVPRPQAEAMSVLAQALNDADPLIRGHAAWALGRVGTTGARPVLEERLASEEDAFVRDEIRRALGD